MGLGEGGKKKKESTFLWNSMYLGLIHESRKQKPNAPIVSYTQFFG